MTDMRGKLTLHDCVRGGDLDKLTKLLNEGCPVDERDTSGVTPLFRSAGYGHTELVKVLISHGADINVKGIFGQTLLHRGAESGNTEIVKLLIQRTGDVHVKDSVGRTPLHISAQSGKTETVELLIQHGADVNVKDSFGVTPLHNSALSGHNEIVKLLLHHGANMDAVDRQGETPLMYAKTSGHSRDTADILRQAKHIQAKDGKSREFLQISSRYSSSRRKLSVQTSGGRSFIKVRYEDKEVRGHVTGAVSTSQTGGEAKGEEVKATTQRNSHGDTNQEHISKSADSTDTSSYVTTSEVDACTSPSLSSTSATSGQTSVSSSPPTAPPSAPLVQLPQTPPPPPLASSLTSSPPEPIDEVTEFARKLLEAVKSKKKTDQDPLSLVVVEQKTENHHHNTYNTYHNHYHNCDCNNKQTISEEVKVENSETLDVSVGSTNYGLLHPPQGDTYEKRDEDEHIYKPGGGEEARKNKHTLDVDVTNVSKSGLSSSSSQTATELRRRLESQAGNIQKMVQSCVAGGGICQDQSSDLVPHPHGGLHVPVNLNLIYQPKHVEVWNTKEVNCEKAEVETAEMMAVNSTCNFNYAAQKTSDDEDNGDNTEDDNSEDDKEIHIEYGED